MSTRMMSVFARVAGVALATSALAGAAFAADLGAYKAPAPAPTPFFIVNDNSVSFTWYANATDPGVGSGPVPSGWCGTAIFGNANCSSNSFSKFQFEATHFDVWKYGTDFFDIAAIKSDSHDPIRGLNGASGAVEFYGFARSTLSFNSLTGTKWFSTWLTKDVALEWGGDANSENNQLSPEVSKLDLGLSFTLNLPGTVNLGVLAQKEWNYNSFMEANIGQFTGCTGAGACFTGDRSFNWAPRLELAVSEPLTFFPYLPLTWNSFTGVTFPKGSGINYQHQATLGLTVWNVDTNETKTEVFEDNRIVLDISKLWWNKAGIWEGYVGWRYWYNKFGTDHNNGDFASVGCTQPGTLGCAPGTSIESTVYLGTTYHFK
jgi:hypothetical protein